MSHDEFPMFVLTPEGMVVNLMHCSVIFVPQETSRHFDTGEEGYLVWASIMGAKDSRPISRLFKLREEALAELRVIAGRLHAYDATKEKVETIVDLADVPAAPSVMPEEHYGKKT